MYRHPEGSCPLRLAGRGHANLARQDSGDAANGSGSEQPPAGPEPAPSWLRPIGRVDRVHRPAHLHRIGYADDESQTRPAAGAPGEFEPPPHRCVRRPAALRTHLRAGRAAEMPAGLGWFASGRRPAARAPTGHTEPQTRPTTPGTALPQNPAPQNPAPQNPAPQSRLRTARHRTTRRVPPCPRQSAARPPRGKRRGSNPDRRPNHPSPRTFSSPTVRPITDAPAAWGWRGRGEPHLGGCDQTQGEARGTGAPAGRSGHPSTASPAQ